MSLFSGYNNLKFDVPFIVERLRLLQGVNAWTWSLLYNKKWIDLYQVLGDEYRSMRLWLQILEIPRATYITGRDIPRLYAEGRYNAIEEYVREELTLCETLFSKVMQVRI